MAQVQTFHQNVIEMKSEKDAFLLDKSLKELKDLRSQLHYAADYCESSFLKSKQKDQVLQNTKEYIYRAVITVVDHLGSLSANLDKIICQNKTIPESELKLESLNQRILTCKEFSSKSALADLCWNPHLPLHNSRYILSSEQLNHGNNLSNARSTIVSNNTAAKVKISGDREEKLDNVIQKWPKVQTTGFDFQEKKTRKAGRKKMGSSGILSLIRGTKLKNVIKKLTEDDKVTV